MAQDSSEVSAPLPFQHLEPGPLVEGELELVLMETRPADPERGRIPDYLFAMRHRESGDSMGTVSFRVDPEGVFTYLIGQVGYWVNPIYRGHNYTERSLRLLFPFFRRHGQRELWVTTGYENLPSRRTLEVLGGILVEQVLVPEHHPNREALGPEVCRYRLLL